MELTSISLNRNAPDWTTPLDIDLSEVKSCAILVGINAGGKSLSLKGIEKFTKLLANPTRSNKADFEKYAKSVDISAMSASYEGSILEMRESVNKGDFIYPEIIDPRKVMAAAGLSPEDVDLDSVFASIQGWSVRFDTRFDFKRGLYERRIGDVISIGIECDPDYVLVDKDGEELDDMPIEEYIYIDSFSEWEEIFDNDPVEGRMIHYGDYSVLLKNGIEVPVWNDEYEFWDHNKRWHFVPNVAQALLVDKAYEVQQELIDKFSLWNKKARFNKRGRNFIDRKLESAYHVAEQEAERLYEEWRRNKEEGAPTDDHRYISERYSDPRRRPRLAEIEVSPNILKKAIHFSLVYPDFYIFEDRGPENRSNWVKNIAKTDLEKTNYTVKLIENYAERRGYKFSGIFSKFLVGEVIPNCTLEFDDAEHRGSPYNNEPNTLIELYEYLITYYGNMIRIFDEEWWYWISVSRFLDFPDGPALTYYSSGQRRLISILENINSSEQRTVFLIDEPELSLHIDWQRRFIRNILQFMPTKMILATHSPDILYHHTEDVIEIPPRSEV